MTQRDRDARMDEALSLEHLLSRMANVQLFIILMRPTELHVVNSDEGKELLREHLQWQFDLEERGLLLGAGPLDFQYKRPTGDEKLVDAIGISIIAATSREEAERIAATEPFRMHGWRETQVVSWHLNEGVGAALARELVAAATTPSP
jgi:uncharacterized protein